MSKIISNKKERRKQRHERNIKKEQEYKKAAWDSGKLIEENHNQGPYSEQYTIDLTERLYKYLGQHEESDEEFIKGFRKYKMKIQDLILHWNPSVPKDSPYLGLKKLLEVYWDKVVTCERLSALKETWAEVK